MDAQTGVFDTGSSREVAGEASKAGDVEARGVAFACGPVASTDGAGDASTGVVFAFALEAPLVTVTARVVAPPEAAPVDAALVVATGRVGAGVRDALARGTHLTVWAPDGRAERWPTSAAVAKLSGRAEEPGASVDAGSV